MTDTFENKQADFNSECKLINLKYEYQGYTGDEKWAIVSELSEKELFEKYPDEIQQYLPFVLLSVEQGEVIYESKRNDHKFEMRASRSGHAFDINDGAFEEHHPEIAVVDDIMEKMELEENIRTLRTVLNTLNGIQKKRVISYFFCEKPMHRLLRRRTSAIRQ